MFTSTLITYIVFGTITLVALILLWVWRYTKAGPNEVLIVSGLGRYRFKRGGTFVLPIFERSMTLSLGLHTLDVHASDAYTKQGIRLLVDGVAQVKIKSDKESIQLAAEQFLGKPSDEVGRVALQVIDGYLRAVLGTMSVEDVYLTRAEFAGKVREASQVDLDLMGLQIVSLTIRHVSDEEGYLEALGKPRVAEVKRDAIIGEAKAEEEAMAARYAADTAIAKSLRDKEIKSAQYTADTSSAKAESDLAYDLQKFKVQQSIKAEEIAVKVKDTELKERELDASVKKPAEAERYRIEMLAKAEKLRLESEGEGRAEATRMEGVAEATAMSEKAKSWKEYNDAAVTQMVVDILPELAGAVAAPLSKTEKIVVVGGGNGHGTGISKVTQDITQIIAELPAVVEGLTGAEISKLIKKVPVLAAATSGNGTSEEE